MTAPRETIEVTAGEVAAQLKRRGIGSDEKMTLTIEPELFPGRREFAQADCRRRADRWRYRPAH